MTYSLVAENPESTVVAEYQSDYKREQHYQSETDLEKAFVKQLQTQAYEYLPITSEEELIVNLRKQLELLNDYQFSDKEWEQFFRSKIANQNNGIEEKTTIIQEDHIQLLDKDDGTTKNIYLLDKTNIHNNRLQVINQYTVDNGQRSNRYDVTVLVLLPKIVKFSMGLSIEYNNYHKISPLQVFSKCFSSIALIP